MRNRLHEFAVVERFLEEVDGVARDGVRQQQLAAAPGERGLVGGEVEAIVEI